MLVRRAERVDWDADGFYCLGNAVTSEELLKKYQSRKPQVGKHKATNNVFLDKVIGSLLESVERKEPQSSLLQDAADALIWSVWWRVQQGQLMECMTTDYLHLQRKVAHGCTDAMCSECDQ